MVPSCLGVALMNDAVFDSEPVAPDFTVPRTTNVTGGPDAGTVTEPSAPLPGSDWKSAGSVLSHGTPEPTWQNVAPVRFESIASLTATPVASTGPALDTTIVYCA